MAADARDLATVANLAAWLGLSSPSQDVQDQLQRLVTGVSVWIQTWLSRAIASAPYTETRNGHGGTRLILGDYPVTAVASVVVDGQTIPQAAGPNLPGWKLANDQIILWGYRFSSGDANVAISYTAGFATVPPDIAQACIDLCALRWKERDRIGHVSKSIGGETVTYMVKDMPDNVRVVLNQYKKVVCP